MVALPGVGRLRDLLESHIGAAGGWDVITPGQLAIVRRVATLETELERREVIFAQAGQADDVALSVYQTAANTLRRLLSELGLERKTKDVTPLEDILAELDPESSPAANGDAGDGR
jgi:hypothetical protein